MTIKDIAQRCGVSVSTVSRVLNDHPDVSASVRAQVQEVIKSVHYVPNTSARDLVKAPADAIGLVVRGVGNPFFTNVIHAVEEACSKAGYTMVLHQIQSGEDELRAGAELARSRRLRGLVLLGGCFDYTPEQIASLSIPFVCCSFTNSFGTLEKEDYSSISIDDHAEAYRAVQMLTHLGHRKIAVLLDLINDHSISQLRYSGYRQALVDSGIEPDDSLTEETGSFRMADSYAGMRRLLDRRDDFTAVFVIADAMAVAAIKALHDCGKRVPEDCSVIAIDGIDISAYSIPTLTTLVQPQEQMGREAVQILVDMVEGRSGNRHVTLRTTLRKGGSMGTPS